MADAKTGKGPISETVVPFSFGNIKVSKWQDGGVSFQLRLDSRYMAVEPNPEWSETMLRAWRDFQDHGVVNLYRSDGLNLIDIGQQMRPDIALIRRDSI